MAGFDHLPAPAGNNDPDGGDPNRDFLIDDYLNLTGYPDGQLEPHPIPGSHAAGTGGFVSDDLLFSLLNDPEQLAMVLYEIGVDLHDEIPYPDTLLAIDDYEDTLFGSPTMSSLLASPVMVPGDPLEVGLLEPIAPAPLAIAQSVPEGDTWSSVAARTGNRGRSITWGGNLPGLGGSSSSDMATSVNGSEDLYGDDEAEDSNAVARRTRSGGAHRRRRTLRRGST
ncbi:uncharacterized protein LOC112269457 [Brachypodium distachyon]|uniref:Uncharacterized protein n=1 Tax=Brachypodium distachyon TaxID=15368 RepID=A0A2K2CG36_BRADI|nr:uncharacterized protein LOC112269457 [Brachypodium distachyon]XP_024312006.1 uncharacterized protein LOC112269457 [Brachypodium distachyon]PNT60994.1 hypothetical protein BRADI_5g08875v3 [Brachypodium distachyon]|eukprot:XP_024312005.1 uncharacterized protein LOC112269457 [Brachypodium distachyon]